MRFLVALVGLALLLGSGCGTKLTITVDPAGVQGASKELSRLLKWLKLEVTEVDATGARFKEQLSRSQKGILRRQLARMVKLPGHAKAPVLQLTVTETDPRVLAALGIKPGGGVFPLALDLDEGGAAMRVQKLGLSSGSMICGYDIPLTKPVPTLTYSLKPPSEAGNDAMSKLRATLSKISLTAAHRLSSVHEAHRSKHLAKLKVLGKNTVSFEFFRKKTYRADQPRAFGVDYGPCHMAILRCDNAFFSGYLFPRLSRYLKSYEL